MRWRVDPRSPRLPSRRTKPRLPRPPSSTCALSTCPGHVAASVGASSPASSSTLRGTATPCRRNKAFPSISAKRIMSPSPRPQHRAQSPPETSMPAPERLPFLDAEPWRVAVINPTGRYARNQVAGLLAAGTPLVGGVALGRGGERLDQLPLYDRVADMPQAPNVAVLYTPAEGVRDAIAQCAAAGVATIVAVAEYVPVHDALAAAACARAAGSWLIGPNTLGMFVPGRGLLGSIAPSFCKAGRLAVIARSGTLTLAVARQLTAAGIGQSLVAHIGGDTVAGRNPHEYLAALAHHDGTDAVLYCGEIGGDKEYALAEAVRGFPKPVVAMLVGRHAPAEKRMGHAGALIGSARESADAKLAALAAGGCKVAKGPEEVISIVMALGLGAGR